MTENECLPEKQKSNDKQVDVSADGKESVNANNPCTPLAKISKDCEISPPKRKLNEAAKQDNHHKRPRTRRSPNPPLSLQSNARGDTSPPASPDRATRDDPWATDSEDSVAHGSSLSDCDDDDSDEESFEGPGCYYVRYLAQRFHEKKHKIELR